MIPCHISIHSNIAQALDLLANPKALVVRLMRCVQHPEGAGPGQSTPPMTENRMEVERAVWWFNPEAEGETAWSAHEVFRRRDSSGQGVAAFVQFFAIQSVGK